MLQRQWNAPASVHALADHLDAALAACEDLLKLSGRHVDLEWYLASVRRFELAAILQVLRVRLYAEELRDSDPRMAPIAELFLAGTIAFTEASGAQVSNPFGSGFDAADRDAMIITDQFPIGRRIPIGALAEMVAAFLDALEAGYLLYERERSQSADGAAFTLPATLQPPSHDAPRH